MDWTTIAIPIASIIASAIVSIVSIWAPMRVEKQRNEREEAKRKEDREREEIADYEHAAIDLLEMLSYFTTEDVRDVDVALQQSGKATNAQQAISILRSRYYVWELKVRSRLSTENEQRVITLRTKIENIEIFDDRIVPMTGGFVREKVPKLVEEILDITRTPSKQ